MSTHILLLAGTHELRFKLLKLFHFTFSHRFSLAAVLPQGLACLNVLIDGFSYGTNPTAARVNIFTAQNYALADASQLEFASKDLVDFALLERKDAAAVEGIVDDGLGFAVLKMKTRKKMSKSVILSHSAVFAHLQHLAVHENVRKQHAIALQHRPIGRILEQHAFFDEFSAYALHDVRLTTRE